MGGVLGVSDTESQSYENRVCQGQGHSGVEDSVERRGQLEAEQICL